MNLLVTPTTQYEQSAGALFPIDNDIEDELTALFVGSGVGVGLTIGQLVVNLVQNKRLPDARATSSWGLVPMPLADGGGLQLVVSR